MRIWLFDIDGTLLDTRGAGQAAYLKALRDLFSVDTVHGLVPFAGRTDLAIALDLFRVHEIDDVDDCWRRFVPAYLAHLERTLCEREGRVLPGVERLLAELTAREDCAVGLLTGNMERGARMKLGHYGLDHYFHFGGFGGEHIDRAEVARLAADAAHENLRGQKHSHTSPSENGDSHDCIVVGDTPHDVHCARAIDATAIAVASGSSTFEELAAVSPDVLLQNLEDRDGLAPYLA